MNNLFWMDEYAKKHKDELQSHATCVVGGLAFRLDPTGRTYYAGLAKNLEKGLADTPPDGTVATSAIEKNEVSSISNGNPPARLF